MQENPEQSLKQQEQDIQALAEFGAECYAGDQAPCAAACPFGVDVVRMVGFAQRDNWRRACSLLREHVLFPGIVSRLCPHPCTTACLPSGLDAAVELPRLEQTAVQLGTAPPRRTAVPRRSQRAAIVGAGLCGLSCAVKLAAGGFSVTVLEQREQLGGRLSGLLPEADYLPELQRQLGFRRAMTRFCWPPARRRRPSACSGATRAAKHSAPASLWPEARRVPAGIFSLFYRECRRRGPWSPICSPVRQRFRLLRRGSPRASPRRLWA